MDLQGKSPEELLSVIDNNLKGYMSQKIIIDAQSVKPLTAEVSKLASLLAAQQERKMELDAHKQVIEQQIKAQTKSKFTTTTTFERKDKIPATATNPVPGMNIDFTMDYKNKIGDYDVASALKYFRNHWDGVKFDEFKASIKHKTFELNLGKFSAKNFAELVKHPSIEYGIGTEIKLDNILANKTSNPEIFDNKFLPSKSFYKAKSERQFFTNNIITAAAGVTKDAINDGEPKEKNVESFESGQYMQYTFAINYRTSIIPKIEVGVSAVHTEEDEFSATIDSSSILPKKNTAYGMDAAYAIMKNLNFICELGWSYFDDNKIDTTASKTDNSHRLELNYKFDPNNVAFIGKNSKAFKYIQNWMKENSLDMNLKIKTINADWAVEGGDAGSDGGKTTRTFSLRHSKKNEQQFKINALDFKYENWENNLNGSVTGNEKTGYSSKTAIKTLLPFNVSYDFSYQLESEWCAANCSDKDEKIYDHTVNFGIDKLFTKFLLNYNFDVKDDRTGAPTDERKKFFSVTLDNSAIKEVPVKFGLQFLQISQLIKSNIAICRHMSSFHINIKKFWQILLNIL